MSEVIENIAKLLEKSLSELGRDIYTIAAFIDEKGNKGFTVGQINEFAKVELKELPTYFLEEEYEAAFKDILFYKREDRHSETYGWMIRKRPNWRVGWRTLWGKEAPELKTAVDAWEAAENTKAEVEAAKPKRENERFSQGDFEGFTTIQIAYRAACMDVMYQRYERRYQEQRLSEWKDSPAGYLHTIYRQQWFLMIKELSYRIQGSPEPKRYRSKKALTAAVADFEKAKDFIERVEAFGFDQFNPKDITGYFFSPEFVKQAIASAEDPDLRVDFEHLPKQPVEAGVVRWMKDHEVVTAFMKFLDEKHDPQSFEYEDKKNILNTLRRLLANAKGQRATDDVIKIGGNDDEK